MIVINTLIKDDPLLTIRHSNWKGKRLTRIVIDSHLRFPLDSKILNTLDKGKILVFTLKNASNRKADSLREKGVTVIPLPKSQNKVNLKEVISWLGINEFSSVLVEGGSLLQTSMIEEKLVDKVFIAISPKLIGGKNAPSLFQGKGAHFIKNSLHLKKISSFQISDDIIMEGYF